MIKEVSNLEVTFLEEVRNVKRIKRDPTNPGLFWTKRVVARSFKRYALKIYMNKAEKV
jgi:hypothetical protein